MAAAEGRLELVSLGRGRVRLDFLQEVVRVLLGGSLRIGSEQALLAFAVAEYAAGKFCQHVATEKMYWARPEVPRVATSCRYGGSWLLKGVGGGV